MGPHDAAPRALEPLQRPDPRWRAHADLPALQLDRARHLALPRPGGDRDPADLLLPPATGVRARRDAALGVGTQPAPQGRGGRREAGALPHRRRPHRDRLRRVRRRHHPQDHRRDRHRPRHRTRGHPGRRPVPRGSHGGPEEGRLLLMPATDYTTPDRPAMDLLRFATAGSVDDGKSTLIGRLLLDSKSIFEDQLEAVEATSVSRGYDCTALALLTDGLRSRREEGAAIDAAYRYFATPRRKFIIADTPGHVQYTRNMVTGASTADLAVVLIDARNGVLKRSRRHAFIAALLGIPHIVVAVNKMDLVGWSQQRFEEISSDFTTWAAKLDVHDITFIPLSALHGDNVVDRSTNMAWYEGPSLLYHLEHVHIASDRNLRDNRFPVQWIVRPMSDEHHDYRGYAGTVAAGTFKPGDEVVILPWGAKTRIKRIDMHE